MKEFKYIILVLFLLFSFGLSAQMTAPSDPGGSPEVDQDPIGGGAPVGSGSIILIGLAAVYGFRKVYLINKEDLLED
jgi:hypothetical protein